MRHLHWVDVHGLPFFAAGARPGHRVNVVLPAPDDDLVGILTRGLSPPHFPCGPRDLAEGWTFERLTEGGTHPEGFEVLAREIPHKGGQTLGLRVDDGHSSFGHLSDHAPLNLGRGRDGQGELHEAALSLADGVDVLIHDAQFLAREFPAVEFLGHASIGYACALAEAAAARTLVLFHHAPARTDDEITAIVDRNPAERVEVVAAAEGMVLEL